MPRLRRRLLKSLIPRGLLARSLLILVTPVILVQFVSAVLFFGTHWDNVTRRLSNALAEEVALIVEGYATTSDPTEQHRFLARAGARTGMHLRFHPIQTLEHPGQIDGAEEWVTDWLGNTLRDTLSSAIHNRIGRPVYADLGSSDRDILIQVQLTDGVLDIRASRKRLYSPTTTIFVAWTVGSAALLLGIATVFMRNQIRSVRRLAAAADSFGKGLDCPEFKPEGATEVRQAATAFLLMRDRIARQLAQRTEMLAGVSHDLRTPLTRMKLELAMMPPEQTADLAEDVAEMERMVEGYLAFARGEGREVARPTDLTALLEDVVGKMRREGAAVDLHCEEEILLPLRPLAMQRCLMNIIGNGRRYAAHVAVRAGRRGPDIEITVDDDGPGIPPDRREHVFKAFTRLEESRNSETGGVGLGLTIARDVVRGQGGDIALEDSPLGGLRVRIRLPH